MTQNTNWETMSLTLRNFSFAASAARRVQRIGDFTQRQEQPVHLHEQPDGVWQMATKLKPGEHHYRFLVDGQWQNDPECNLRVPNPFGCEDSVREVVRDRATTGTGRLARVV
jgi:1,4-alpha-glucan branching enzyme